MSRLVDPGVEAEGERRSDGSIAPRSTTLLGLIDAPDSPYLPLTTTVLPGALFVLIVTCLNACPGAVACETAGCIIAGTYGAIALHDDNFPVFVS